MDEDISIINTNTRNEKIKNFFFQNKKRIIFGLIVIIILLISYFGFGEYQDRKKVKISDSFNSITINYSKNNKEKTAKDLIKLVNEKNSTYSLLSLYFIIDNELINEKNTINELFDVVINEISLDDEVKNLNIYKKALYNANDSSENDLLEILNPLIKSESVWKSHALYLMAEFFYSKNEMQKSKEFFIQIVSLENANKEIKLEAQKRLNRDLSE
ncbi:tetratricopeptide repeat protein [Pelagibacterales bacterium SAG-MED38]|nr:tetratricopeptide repeat protein [Pelagibacterales bacterium SAG-MED38]